MRIAILGVGLIGGSLALAWKKRRPALHLTGYDAPNVLEAAHARGALDARAATAGAAVAEADLVVLATPIAASLHLLETIAPRLRPGALVTDVGSVKTPITEHARAVLGPENTFVGGHPMAGSERGGVAHADAFLFENATYVLCPPEDAPHETFAADYAALVELIRLTGARLLLLEAERHDRIAAAVSHLPQLLAVTLMNLVADYHDDDGAFLRLAAGGFRDMTRIASSPFTPWRDILIANEGPILDLLGAFATALQKTRHRLAEENLDALEVAFTRARERRDAIPRDTKGFLAPLADLTLYAEDKPGFLLRMTEVLYDAGLNIKDIELLKIREGEGGAFRLGFADPATADAAVAALRDAGYTASRM